MNDYSRGYAAGLKAAAEYAATHTGSDSPVFRDTVTATETIRFAYQWQRAVYAGIISLPIEGDPNPGEQVPDSARIAQPTEKEIATYRDTFRRELDKRMDTKHPSASPSTEAHGIALRQFVENRNAAARSGPCVVVPTLAWEGFKSLVLAKCGKPVNRDKTPAELIEMARAMLAAAREEHSQHLRNEGLRISAESVDAVDREEHDARR